jgi:hypothetical protein
MQFGSGTEGVGQSVDGVVLESESPDFEMGVGDRCRAASSAPVAVSVAVRDLIHRVACKPSTTRLGS